jgi:hypothetical protein
MEVQVMKRFIEFIQEGARTSLSRMNSHMSGRTMGIISASRKERTPEENNKRSKELEGHLKNSGFGYFARKGKYQYADGKMGSEKSFVVMNKHKGDDGGSLHSFLSQHGDAHDQESFVHKSHDSTDAHLHFLQDTPENKRGDHFSIGPFRPNYANPYGHTVMSEPGNSKKGQTPASNKTFSFAPHED